MSEKKPWWKIGLGAAVAGILGVGVEEGFRRTDSPKIVADENPEEVVDKPTFKPATEKKVSQEDEKRRLQKRKDEEETRKVKEFIKNIYKQQPFEEQSVNDGESMDLEQRHVRLVESLEKKLGKEFVIDKSTSEWVDQDENHMTGFKIKVVNNNKDISNEIIKVNYEDDGSISVEDEGIGPKVNIKADERLVNNMIYQINKVLRMRDEYKKYLADPSYTSDQYEDFLRRMGYDNEQIKFIRGIKGRDPDSILKDLNKKNDE